MKFTDEMLEKWKYALKNIWAIKVDREETEALLHRLECAEKCIESEIDDIANYEAWRASKGL